jgi:dATP pyrophosphohydrolase
MVQRHRKVQVVVCSQNAVLLLQTNAKRGGFWQNVTGSVEEQEDWADAAIRELLEETGLRIRPNNLIDLNLQWQFMDRWGRDVEEKAFLATVDHVAKGVILSDEHQQFQWLSLTQEDWSLIKFESNRQAITAAVTQLRSR